MTLVRLILLAVNVALAVLIWRGVAGPEVPAATAALETDAVPSDPAAPEAVEPAAAPALADAGPALFRPARSSEPVAEAAPAAPEAAIRLVGVILGPQPPVAVLALAADPTPRRARLDDEIDGWRLARIARKEIVLERAGARRTIPLDPPDEPNAEPNVDPSAGPSGGPEAVPPREP